MRRRSRHDINPSRGSRDAPLFVASSRVAEAPAAQMHDIATFQQAIDNRISEVRIVQHAAPRVRGLVRGDDNRAACEVAAVNDLEQQVGGIRAVGQVAQLVNHEDIGIDERVERFVDSLAVRSM